MEFPYKRYQTLVVPDVDKDSTSLKIAYPKGQEELARWIIQSLGQANTLLAQLLEQAIPTVNVLLVAPTEWELAPHEDPEELSNPHPYWTDATVPSTIVVPLELDPIFGEFTREKLLFMLYHELTVAFLEENPAPWPQDYPLWADEWQIKFAALWLFQQITGKQDIVNHDLFERYGEIFEPEPDGKTPITVRGFEWYEDTIAEDYLCYELLLEQLAADLLGTYGPEILPRFLALYRQEHQTLLSDQVTTMLGQAIGPEGVEWLEELVYF